jgi:hypothetical protein
MIVDPYMFTATRTRLRITLLVGPWGRTGSTILRPAGFVVIPDSDGYEPRPDTVCYRPILHPDSLHSRLPRAETHW